MCGMLACVALTASVAAAAEAASAAARSLHPTLDGSIVVGFQGWFACPGDGRRRNGWYHWFTANTPDADHLHFDLMPDVGELDADELCPTNVTRQDGTPLMLFSDQNPKTVRRQFGWMRDYRIGAAALQRFVVDLPPDRSVAGRDAVDRVLANVKASAEATGVGFYVMYDIAGADPDRWADLLLDDWRSQLAAGLTASPAYQHHGGRPVLAIAGVGSTDRPGDAAHMVALVTKLREASAAYGGVTLIASSATNWRTRDGDAKPAPDWDAAYDAFDIISPWTVGRYRSTAGLDSYMSGRLRPDMAAAAARRLAYMPVIFPGFSWHNLKHAASAADSPVDAIPRRGGAFLREQAEAVVKEGATMIYIAMFDEVDEGTAIFKLESDPRKLPREAVMVRNQEGERTLPDDWYLQEVRTIKSLIRSAR